jgi:hypothetical protein
MSNLRSTIENLASQFASSVLDALRGVSLDELADIARSGSSAGGARRGRPRAASEGAAPAAAGRRRGGGGRLGRRSAGDITRMVESIVDLLGRNADGLRAEQIREALNVEAKELPRPLAEAISSGRITKSGQKRATTYFAGSGGGASGAPKRRGRKPAGRKKR